MFRLIEKLQKRPEAARKRIAIMTAAAITGIIFLVWLSVLAVRVNDESDDMANVDNNTSPISILGDNIADLFDNAKSQFNELRKGIESIVQ